MATKGIVVVGSLNLDLVVQVDKIPAVGETVLGGDFQTHPGGKGANQAAEVGLLKYPVHMIGRVGSDDFGKQLRHSLDSKGVDTTAVTTTDGPSGIAMIEVQASGDNNIVVASGANALLTPADLDAHIDLIRNAGIVLTQLETPIPTLEHLAAICGRENVPLMLDPAPAASLPADLLSRLTWITPNETEAQSLTGRRHALDNEDEVRALAETLLKMGPKNVIIKLGENGAYLALEDGTRVAVPAFEVKAVDTTAAGDCFNGAFAVALASGSPPLVAARFAAAASAISVTRPGAQPSMPTLTEVLAFLKAHRDLRKD
ncbi:MAG: ribokinase [Terracidiphilus sp.]|jgi:ribokinase